MLKQALVIGLALTGLAVAQDAPLPRARPAPPPDDEAGPVLTQLPLAQDVPLPRVRPAPPPPLPVDEIGLGPSGDLPVIVSPPPKVYQVACPAVIEGKVVAEALPPIHEGQCGIQSPLSLSALSVNGREVPLSTPVVTDCGMASALPEWLAEVDRYVAAREKTEIESVAVATGYQCRNVNHAESGNLSFHAFADAVDVIGFTLEDGRTIDMASGWNGSVETGREVLRFARDAACAHFTTVLGPDADAFHKDNLHLDLACHGKACTVRLCQ